MTSTIFTRLGIAVLIAGLGLTGCGTTPVTTATDPSAVTPSTSDTSPATDPSTPVRAGTPYSRLWEEFAVDVLTAEDSGPAPEKLSPTTLNAWFGWNEGDLASVAEWNEGREQFCIVSSEGVYLAVTYAANGPMKTLMGEGESCSYDDERADVIATDVSRHELAEFDVSRGYELVAGASLVIDPASAATRDVAEVARNAAQVVEALALGDERATSAQVEDLLDEMDGLPDGAEVSLRWGQPADRFDLGYDLCAEMSGGAWAAWDSAVSEVAETGTDGGCPAP